MPGLRFRSDDPVPEEPLEWRPQVPLATRRAPVIRDPILEPLWSGRRVIVHFESAKPADEAQPAREPASPQRLAIIEATGADITADEPDVAGELGGAIVAFDAVIDGILSRQATRSGVGAAVIHRPQVSRGSVFLPRDAGIEVERKDGGDDDTPVAFVAFDLLRLDGQRLLDLPLLERKRLLESVIVQSERVRISVHARPPVDPWVASWKSAGFRGAMLKSANGRYAPGGYADDWTPLTRIHQRR